MPTNDDMPALESWLREKALEAHNLSGGFGNCSECRFNNRCFESDMGEACLAIGVEYAFNETIAKIQSGRVNQRPHVIFTED